MSNKAAVVIGVDKPGSMPPLKSAASCAREVETWLSSEGFDVTCLTDQSDPVTAGQVKEAITQYVQVPPRYHLLLVYFSGHGFWVARNDLWLLSNAPSETDQAVSLDGAIDLARYSGIPNVVFVSDACRSIPDSRVGAVMKGIDAFPNYADITSISKVDYFKATSDAQAAYEGTVNGKPTSMLTHALLSAYVQASDDMILEIDERGEKIRVIPNRRLESFLQAKISETLTSIDVNLVQVVDTNVPSSDDVYIGRYREPSSRQPAQPNTSLTDPDLTAAGHAADAIGRVLSTSGLNRYDSGSLLDVDDDETEDLMGRHLPQDQVDHFESQCGFAIIGAQVIDVVCTKGNNNASAELVDTGDGADQPAVLRIWDADPGVTVVALLGNERGIILPGLAGYIGHGVINDSGMINVSYVPSSNHRRFYDYEQSKTAIDRLRALVAIAINNDRFRLRSDREARSLGDQIRMGKAMDPTLGLYAAHAFSQAGEEGRILSVLDYMRSDLQADLFDLRVLASRHPAGRDGPVQLPFCPMLTQTWNLLRPRGIDVPPALGEASAYLCNSLWTTFEPEGAKPIFEAVKAGELT